MAHCKSTGTHIREALYIFLGAGLVLGAILYFLDVPEKRLLVFTGFNAVTWSVMWKGNEIIAINLDRRIPWLEAPGRRFLVGLAAMFIYVALAASLINFVLFLILNPKTGFQGISGEILESTLIASGITVVIMLFLYSKSFFKSWRQAAINVEKLKRESIASQYEVLKNQVNPHFLFNTLNALTALIYEDREKAIKFINKFSEVYRYVLDSRDKEVVAVSEELNFIRAFVYLLQVRYEDNLTVDIPGNPVEGYIPPMVLQLLVENAVKHNVIADDQHLNISIRLDDRKVVIENNLTGKKEHRENTENPEGIGLRNIISRYEILTDRRVEVEHENRCFRVTLPVLKMENS
jgi:LytS/YehU family sensor histidine kinase